MVGGKVEQTANGAHPGRNYRRKAGVPHVASDARTRLLLAAVAQWNQQHPHRQIDPQAERAVASREGLSGGIGDGGHAFGPNQLNDAGGVLTGKFAGKTPEQINEWAWSPEGLQYALAGVAGAAGGEHGAQAVSDIVNRFERPAAPGAETAGALQAYGAPQTGGGMSSLAQAAGGGTGQQSGQQPGRFAPAWEALQNAVGSDSLDRSGVYRALGAALRQQQSAPAAAMPARAGGQSPSQLALAAIPDGFATRGGIQVDSNILNTVDQLAQRFGVKVNSGYRSAQRNAQVGGATNSDHLRGDAVDFTGDPARMAALYRYAQGRFPYVEPMAQAKNHVHVSFRR